MRGVKNALPSMLLLLAVSVSSSSIAADAVKKEGAFGKGVGPFLTREQLRGCIGLKTRIAKQDDDQSREQTAIAALKDDLVRAGDANKAALESLDRSNAEAVAAYNLQSQARDQRIDEYQARVTAFNARAEAGKADRDAYIKGCNNRRYFEDDEAAINAGK
jgi:hypothetical protein